MKEKVKKTLLEKAEQNSFPSKINIQSIIENKKKKRKRLGYILSPLVLCLVFFSFIGINYINNNSTKSENLVGNTISYSYAFNPEDKRELVGFSQNVFIGKVISEEGSEIIDLLPETQFNVKVIKNIKGTLKQEIIVNQQGGYMEEELVLVEGDNLLEEGKEYLFVTKYNEEKKFHTLVPIYGDILIKSEQEKAELIKQFNESLKNEIPLE